MEEESDIRVSATSELQSEATTNKKKRKQRSEAWSHFESFKNAKGDCRANCLHCGKDVAADLIKNGTSCMTNHLRSCKGLSSEVQHSQLSFLPSRNKEGEGTLSVWRYDNEVAKEKFYRMMVVLELPFRFVEAEEFKEWVDAIQPKFHVPSRWTIGRECYKVFVGKKESLKSLLHDPTQRVCLTTDTWTSNQRINYMCLTAHFIDKNWTLHKRILIFCPITSHKGEAIGLAIEKCLREWEITRVLAITVDNASSNDVALTKLRSKMATWDSTILRGEHLHMRCVAHILNLIVQHGLKLYNVSIVRVRNAVRYVRASPARLVRFGECVNSEKIQDTKSLCLDVPTRWNSTYMMLDVAQRYQKDFDRYDEQDMGFESDLREEGERTRIDENAVSVKEWVVIDGRPTFDDWVNVRQFSSLLRIFYDLTLKISGAKYVTANIFLHELYSVYSTLQSWIEGDNPSLFAIGDKMFEKFNKYWGDPTKMNNLLFIVVVLDPRHKLQYVIYLLKHMFGGDVGVRAGKSLEESLFKMFNEYKSRITLEKTPQVDPCSLGSSSSSGIRALNAAEQLRIQFERDNGIRSEDGSPSDLDEYLSEKPKIFRENESFDILDWWKINAIRFPVLSQMARDVLAMPISTVASESAFSTGGRVLNDFRSSLTPKMVEALICAQDWMRSTIKALMIEEEIEEMENLDKDIAKLFVDVTTTTPSSTASASVAS